MSNPNIHQEEKFQGVVIDSNPKETIDKTSLLKLLKAHHVDTTTVENPETHLEDIIPSLRKAKVNLSEAFCRDLAEKLCIPFIDFIKVKKIYAEEQRSKLIAVLPYSIISKYKVIPLEAKGQIMDLAVDNPLDSKVLIAIQYLFGQWKINLQVVSSKSIDWAIDNIYNEIHKKNAMLDLYNRAPNQSAYRVLYPKQKYFIIGTIAAFTAAIILDSVVTLMVLFSAISILYFIVNPIKIYISIRGFKGGRAPTRITRGEILWARDEDFPVYTVLVPVFREAGVLAQNMHNMYHLNYPKSKLDIKILMEERDGETINEAKALGLFGGHPKKTVEGIPCEEYAEFLKLFDPIVIPGAKVTTKPRACNYGLLRAKGELCVIYDAEDCPDPDQLKKAAIVFLRSPEDVVCLQSKLNFYNANENILTKWFSIEYANWYEFYLQGLDWIEAPIPLGGTSNHFRKKGLDQLGRWDPYNVTEDADIGIRLARQKLKTEMIDTYTYEEATVTAKSWVVQRSRWFKGHLQTYLVHMRDPEKLYRDLGFDKFAKLQLTFGTSVFIPLVNPILWVLLAATFVAPMSVEWLIPSYLQPLCLFNLIVGNISYIAIYVVACARLKKNRYIPYALAMPAYWAMLSFAAWRG
ncbi:MAG TPA: glycosyltransferase family 2 protein, partial [Candidatus Acidoferrales bacterium]|nr:glycosyltransferase family 2 protein [Candidatus Acidoferrales bacterium]